jgi:hypothetical protein
MTALAVNAAAAVLTAGNWVTAGCCAATLLVQLVLALLVFVRREGGGDASIKNQGREIAQLKLDVKAAAERALRSETILSQHLEECGRTATLMAQSMAAGFKQLQDQVGALTAHLLRPND